MVKEVDLAPYGFTNASLLADRHTVRYDLVGTTIRTTLDGKPVDTFTDATFSKGYIGFRTHGCCGERGTVYDAVVTGADGGTLLDTDFASDRNPFTGGEIVGSALVVSGTTDALKEPAVRPLPLLRKGFATKAARRSPPRGSTRRRSASTSWRSTARRSATRCSPRAGRTTTSASSPRPTT